MPQAPLRMVLEGETDLVITRRFAAPPALVFRAHTEPALVRRWMLGPPGWEMPVCEIDLRPGGLYRHEYDDGQGNGFALVGEFHEIEPGARIVQTEWFMARDASPGNRIETRFEPEAGGTRMVMRMHMPDAASRKAMLDTGMTDGMEQSYQALDGLLAAPG